MANPPIVIGPFANVPAPGSPIKSDWPQEISTVVTALAMSLSKSDYYAVTPNTGSIALPTGSTVSIAPNISIPAVPYRSLLIGHAQWAVSNMGGLTYVDMYLDVGAARRGRHYTAGTMRSIAFALIAANTATTVTLTASASAAGTVTAGGGGDMNTVQVVRIPVPETPT